MPENIRVLKAYLESDRQWTRLLRISHAQFMLKEANSASERRFWQAVLEANEDEK